MLRQQSEPSSTHAIVAKPEHGTAATDLPDDLLNPRPPNARPHGNTAESNTAGYQ
jgi:hypothetical protein